MIRHKPPETIDIPRAQVSCNLRKGAQRSSTTSSDRSLPEVTPKLMSNVKTDRCLCTLQIGSMSRWTYITLSTKPFTHASATATTMRGAIRKLFLIRTLIFECSVVRCQSQTKQHKDKCLQKFRLLPNPQHSMIVNTIGKDKDLDVFSYESHKQTKYKQTNTHFR